MVDLDEVAHNEPPHQDLCCLQFQLFSLLILKELTAKADNTDVDLPSKGRTKKRRNKLVKLKAKLKKDP